MTSDKSTRVGMTSRKKGGAPFEMMARVRNALCGRTFCLLLSSRGRRRRNPGSSDLAVMGCLARCPRGRRRHLRSACLDPGSALRAVRDDIKRKGAPSGMTSRERERRPGGRQKKKCAVRDDGKSKERAVREDVRRRSAPSGRTSGEGGCAVRDDVSKEGAGRDSGGSV